MKFKVGDKVLPNIRGRVDLEFESWSNGMDCSEVMTVLLVGQGNEVDFLKTTVEPLYHPATKYALIHNAEEL